MGHVQGPKIGQIALHIRRERLRQRDDGRETPTVSAAGTSFRLSVDEIRKSISELGYEPRQRDNWYRLLD